MIIPNLKTLLKIETVYKKFNSTDKPQNAFMTQVMLFLTLFAQETEEVNARKLLSTSSFNSS